MKVSDQCRQYINDWAVHFGQTQAIEKMQKDHEVLGYSLSAEFIWKLTITRYVLSRVLPKKDDFSETAIQQCLMEFIDSFKHDLIQWRPLVDVLSVTNHCSEVVEELPDRLDYMIETLQAIDEEAQKSGPVSRRYIDIIKTQAKNIADGVSVLKHHGSDLLVTRLKTEIVEEISQKKIQILLQDMTEFLMTQGASDALGSVVSCFELGRLDCWLDNSIQFLKHLICESAVLLKNISEEALTTGFMFGPAAPVGVVVGAVVELLRYVLNRKHISDKDQQVNRITAAIEQELQIRISELEKSNQRRYQQLSSRMDAILDSVESIKKSVVRQEIKLNAIKEFLRGVHLRDFEEKRNRIIKSVAPFDHAEIKPFLHSFYDMATRVAKTDGCYRYDRPIKEIANEQANMLINFLFRCKTEVDGQLVNPDLWIMATNAFVTCCRSCEIDISGDVDIMQMVRDIDHQGKLLKAFFDELINSSFLSQLLDSYSLVLEELLSDCYVQLGESDFVRIVNDILISLMKYPILEKATINLFDCNLFDYVEIFKVPMLAKSIFIETSASDVGKMISEQVGRVRFGYDEEPPEGTLKLKLSEHHWIVSCSYLEKEQYRIVDQKEIKEKWSAKNYRAKNELRVWRREDEWRAGVCVETAMIGLLARLSAISFVSCGTLDYSLQIWSLVGSGLQLTFRRINAHNATINALVTRDWGEPLIFTGAADKRIKVWNQRGGPLQIFKGHTDSILALMLVLNGEKLLSAASDKTLRLWDLNSGTCLRLFVAHADLAFSVGQVMQPVAMVNVSKNFPLTVVRLALENLEEFPASLCCEKFTQLHQKALVLHAFLRLVFGIPLSSDGNFSQAIKEAVLIDLDEDSTIITKSKVLRCHEAYQAIGSLKSNLVLYTRKACEADSLFYHCQIASVLKALDELEMRRNHVI